QWSVLLCCSSSSDQVDQTPADIYTKGEDVKVYCSHSIQSYNKILWYKQSKKQLQYLGYMNIDKGYPETGVNVTMEGNANKGENCTLTIKYLKLSSSGVYFCAASYHSAAHHCTSMQKPNKIST
uniref:Ig-like domain-containing protein n=1 Tax=Neolamprologus brichardi TaxID=32507 RepID=A0A3Q4MA07_NEOBR